MSEWKSVAALNSEYVGSRETCNPPPTDTDQDVLVLIRPEQYKDYVVHLFDLGFELDGSHISNERAIAYDSGFQSFKKQDLNLIVTGSQVFYMRFVAASSVAKRLNLMQKDDRIALFQAVLYANSCS